MGKIAVSRAEDSEAAGCLALLPEVQPLLPELLIARYDGQMAGAAGVVWRSWGEPPGLPLSIQVLPALRRRGVGRALVQAALDLARGEADGLWSIRPLPEDGPEAAFLTACGFVMRRRERHFIADVASLLAEIGPMADRLRASGRLPPQARIVPLVQAPLDEVGWLLSNEFGGGPLRAAEQARRRQSNSRGERSIAVMEGEALAGVLICRIRDEVGVVDAWVAAPAWRGGWVNIALLEAILLQGQADGVEDFRFYCDDEARHTLRLARRCAATEVATDAMFYQALSSDP